MFGTEPVFFQKGLATVPEEAFCVTFCEAFHIDMNTHELISLVGTGGKTSIMFRLAQEFNSLGKKVLVTTAINIAFSETSQASYPQQFIRCLFLIQG
jgi:UDP-N-acetylmuramyl tripeptide synthase